MRLHRRSQRAGKTTLLSNIAGLYRPRSGTIGFNGKQIAGLGPERISQLGISMCRKAGEFSAR